MSKEVGRDPLYSPLFSSYGTAQNLSVNYYGQLTDEKTACA